MANKLVYNTETPVTVYEWNKYSVEEKNKYTWEQYTTSKEYNWMRYRNKPLTNYFYSVYNTQSNTSYCFPLGTITLDETNLDVGKLSEYTWGTFCGMESNLIYWDSVNLLPSGATLEEREAEMWMIDNWKHFVANLFPIDNDYSDSAQAAIIDETDNNVIWRYTEDGITFKLCKPFQMLKIGLDDNGNRQYRTAYWRDEVLYDELKYSKNDALPLEAPLVYRFTTEDLKQGITKIDNEFYGCKTGDTLAYNFAGYKGKLIFFPGLKAYQGQIDSDGYTFGYDYTASFSEHKFKPTCFLVTPETYYKDGVLYNAFEVTFNYIITKESTSQAAWGYAGDVGNAEYYVGYSNVINSILSAGYEYIEGPTWEKTATDMTETDKYQYSVPFTVPTSLQYNRSTGAIYTLGFNALDKTLTTYFKEPKVRNYVDADNLVDVVTSTDANAYPPLYYNEEEDLWYVSDPTQRGYNWTATPTDYLLESTYTYKPYSLKRSGYINYLRATDQNILDWNSGTNRIYTVPSRQSYSDGYWNAGLGTELHLYKYPVNHNQVPRCADDTPNRVIITADQIDAMLDKKPSEQYFPFVGSVYQPYDTYNLGKWVAQGYNFIAAEPNDDCTSFYCILPNTYVTGGMVRNNDGEMVPENFGVFNSALITQAATTDTYYGIHGKFVSLANSRLSGNAYVPTAQIGFMNINYSIFLAEYNDWHLELSSTPSNVSVNTVGGELLCGLNGTEYWMVDDTVTNTYVMNPSRSITVGADESYRFPLTTDYNQPYTTTKTEDEMHYLYRNRVEVTLPEEEKGPYIKDVESFDADEYPIDGIQGSFWYVYKGAELDYWQTDEVLETLISLDSSKYPTDGRKLGYWYTLLGSSQDTIIPLTDEYILGGVNYKQTMATGDTLTLGMIASAQIDFRLKDGHSWGPVLEGKQCDYYVKQPHDTDWRKIGVFYNQEVDYDTNISCKITAQDILYKLNQEENNFVTDSNSQRLTYTLAEAVQDAGMGTLVQNDTNPLPINYLWDATSISGKYSHRDVIAAVAEINCGFVCANRDGQVEFRQFTDNDKTLDNTQYSLYHRKPYNPVVFHQIKFVGTQNDNIYEYYLNDGNAPYATSTYTALDNCVAGAWDDTLTADDINSTVFESFQLLLPITFVPSYLDLLEDWDLEIGEVINVAGNKFIILEKTMDASGCKFNCYGR